MNLDILVGIAVVVWMILAMFSCRVASDYDDTEDILLAEYREENDD